MGIWVKQQKKVLHFILDMEMIRPSYLVAGSVHCFLAWWRKEFFHLIPSWSQPKKTGFFRFSPRRDFSPPLRSFVIAVTTSLRISFYKEREGWAKKKRQGVKGGTANNVVCKGGGVGGDLRLIWRRRKRGSLFALIFIHYFLSFLFPSLSGSLQKTQTIWNKMH